jgi:hypothetical protein
MFRFAVDSLTIRRHRFYSCLHAQRYDLVPLLLEADCFDAHNIHDNFLSWCTFHMNGSRRASQAMGEILTALQMRPVPRRGSTHSSPASERSTAAAGMGSGSVALLKPHLEKYWSDGHLGTYLVTFQSTGSTRSAEVRTLLGHTLFSIRITRDVVV